MTNITPEFVEFPKTSRLWRDIIITEKLDGTNAQICIGEDGSFQVGSRNRWITPADDNYGFARWAAEHKEELLTLGPGRHFGEWWGSGIQRGYGLTMGEKRFSLFNVTRWCKAGSLPAVIPSANPTAPVRYQETLPACVGLVPVLYEGRLNFAEIHMSLNCLSGYGSQAAPGFMNPEGIIVHHTHAGTNFKVTLNGDGHEGAK